MLKKEQLYNKENGFGLLSFQDEMVSSVNV